MDLNIREINILPIRPQQGLVGFVSFILNQKFCISNVAIHLRPAGCGIRLVYPDRQLPNGRKVNCFFPIDRETGDAIEKVIQEAYFRLQDKAKTRG